MVIAEIGVFLIFCSNLIDYEEDHAVVFIQIWDSDCILLLSVKSRPKT